ncbi:hypothetical protein [Sorangium sp. So ce131]|uniref:hypothetical protein n=1 Tax=Sorangium sp. So ce131 TaxID=3133282 RepID=UPI003F623097
MTPETAYSVATRARALRAGLAPSMDPVAAATAARRLFEDAGDDVRVRWLSLELHGYGPAMSAIGPLPKVLCVAPHDRLAAHVAAYRTQRATRPGSPDLVHFFVEALPELVAARQQASSVAGAELELSFGPDPGSSEYPTTATFPRNVFERVLEGFLAALHLQLGTLG